MAMLNDLDGFVENGEYGDDMTMLVMKWHGRGLSTDHRASQEKETTAAEAQTTNSNPSP